MAYFLTHIFITTSLVFLYREKGQRFLLFLMICVAAILPDVDVFFSDSRSNLFSHRGVTHSFFFILFISTVFSVFFWGKVKNFLQILFVFFIFFIAGFSHIILDLMTEDVKGVCLYCPFDESRTMLSFKPFKSFVLSSGGPSRKLMSGTMIQFLLPEIIYVWVPSIIAFISFITLSIKLSPTEAPKKRFVYQPIKKKVPSQPKKNNKPKNNINNSGIKKKFPDR
jgi:membrane-bound metal-dependent hydrolase YbcI (DUF457 family)